MMNPTINKATYAKEILSIMSWVLLEISPTQQKPYSKYT